MHDPLEVVQIADPRHLLGSIGDVAANQIRVAGSQ